MRGGLLKALGQGGKGVSAAGAGVY